MRQDLDRALAAGDRRVDLGLEKKPQRLGAPPDLVERRAPEVRIAHLAPLDLPVGQLELRLDQHHPLGTRAQAERQRAEHVAGGDEADVDGEEIKRPLGLRERQLSPVDPFERRDARVGAERRVQLAVPHVDRQHAGRAVGQAAPR